jgi:hypothetical protein
MPDPGVENTYLVEHYRPGLGAAQLGQCVDAVRSRIGTTGPPGSSPRVLWSVIVPTDEAFLVVFCAESERQLQKAYHRAGATFDRICIAILGATPT